MPSTLHAFTASKNDERIKGALAHIIRIISEVKYVTGNICKTTLHNTAHNNNTTDNKTIWSHYIQQIALYCPHTVKLLLTPI